MAREKGWASSVKGRATATHYVRDPHNEGTPWSACNRAALRVLERDLTMYSRDVRARLRGLPVCDPCQAARRRKRA